MQGLTILGSTIDITNAAGTLTNFAFQVPRAGIITSFSAFFSTTASFSLQICSCGRSPWITAVAVYDAAGKFNPYGFGMFFCHPV